MTQEGFDAALTDDEDDHGQAQPQLASAFFGRLVTLGRSNEQDLRLVLPEHTVGRVDSCSLVLRYPFVSSVHARIRCGPEGVSIEDCSTNGLWINGAKLSTKATVSLGHNDEVAFAPPRAEGDMAPPLRFTFTAPPPPAAAAPAAAADPVVAELLRVVAGAAASSSESEPPAPPPPPAAAGNEEEEGEKHLVCGICQDLLYRPVSAQPCLHNFCSACYSSWMARSDNCPECRQAVRMVARNHLLASIVDEFVLKHPHKQREAAERARMDSEDKIGSEPVRVGSKRRRDAESEASDDYSDDEDDPAGLGIHPAAWMGMHPALVAAHVAAGHVQMSPCACCDRATPAPLLASLRDKSASTLPARCLGNPMERQILVEYLQQRGLSTNEMLQDCLGRAAAGSFELTTSSGGTAVAVDARICHVCWDAVFSTLCYQFRAAIPAARLPAGVTSRPDCWYGRDCRTQRTKPTHAERLNHICQPVERGKGGKGKGGGGKGGGGGGGKGGDGGKGGGGGGKGAGGGGGGGGGAAAADGAAAAAAAAAGVAAGDGSGAGDAAGA